MAIEGVAYQSARQRVAGAALPAANYTPRTGRIHARRHAGKSARDTAVPLRDDTRRGHIRPPREAEGASAPKALHTLRRDRVRRHGARAARWCGAYAAQRSALVEAVRKNIPHAVLSQVGRPEDSPREWLALLLDGELQGVPFAEVYGRSLKAVRGFKGFWRPERAAFRRDCYKIVESRRRLRTATRPILVDIMRDLERRAGIVRAPMKSGD